MKKIIIASVLALGLATGVTVYAHNSGYGHGYGMGGYGGHMMGGGYGMMGPGMMGGGYGNYGMMGPNMMYGGGYGNCPGGYYDRDDWNSGAQQKFLNETVDLRKKLSDKQFDLVEAERNPDTSRDKIVELQKEIYDIQAQLQEKAQKLLQ